MSKIEIIDVLEDKVKHVVSDLKNVKKMSRANESLTLDLTNKLAKIELKIKKMISIIEQN
jgi:tryptophanyl-tRNA synthetase